MSKQNASSDPQVPKLAPPGAGVPFLQKLGMKYFIKPFIAAKTPWEVSEKNFRRVNEKILAEIKDLTDTQLSTRVLVPPQTGLEDSSRYWSISMALEHLVIVSSEMARLVPLLSKGLIPEGKADTAAVKPHGEMSTQESLKQFKKFITTDFEKLNSSIENRDSKTRFLHPWFGEMTAKEWYWLLPMHHGLHLKQIREIKKKLPLN